MPIRSARNLREIRDGIANTIGFRINSDRAYRPEAAHARGNSRHCRRDRTFVAAVPQRRRRSRPAEGQSLDRGRDRAQAVPRPAAYRDHRTARFRALAEGRPRARGRARRRRGRAFRRPACRPSAAGRRQWRQRQGRRFSFGDGSLSAIAGAGPRLCAGRRAALEPEAQERHRYPPAGGRPRPGDRDRDRARSRARSCCRATSRRSIFATPIASRCACRTRRPRRAPKRSRPRRKSARAATHELLAARRRPQDEAGLAEALGVGRSPRCRHQQDRVRDRAARADPGAGRAAATHPCGRGDRLRPYRGAAA